MPTDEICGLFEEIGDPAKRDAVLFLWATNPMLQDALRVMAAWGFTYVHHWIWDKEIAGTGYWGRDRHELLLIGKRGNPVPPLPGSQPETVYRERKGRHSAKPDHFAEQIERLYPDMLRLELFCRTPRPGWRAWGYEASTSESDVA
jgi:N6-adenosine-specific RNA methylase IME4